MKIVTLMAVCLFVASILPFARALPENAASPTLAISSTALLLNGVGLKLRNSNPADVVNALGIQPKKWPVQMEWNGRRSYQQYVFDSEGISADFETNPDVLWRIDLNTTIDPKVANSPKRPFVGQVQIGGTALKAQDLSHSFFSAAQSAGLTIFDVEGDEKFQIKAGGWNLELRFRHDKKLDDIFIYPGE
jgi:hypothetical protein